MKSRVQFRVLRGTAASAARRLRVDRLAARLRTRARTVAARLIKRGHAEIAELIGSNARAQSLLDGSNAAVLLYHRVLPRDIAESTAVEPGMFVTPTTYRQHLDWLRDGYRVLPLSEIVSRIAQGQSLPPRAIAITFDDGWRDNFDYAFPELQARSLPATVFVVTERVGSEGAFWPDEVCRRFATLSWPEQESVAASLGAAPGTNPLSNVLVLFKSLPEEERMRRHEQLVARTSSFPRPERELLDWAQVEQAATAGIDFESHGATHALLTRVTPRTAEQELKSSLASLRDRGLGRQGLLAYPSGAYNDRIARAAAELGYRAAFTTEPGLVSASCDSMALPRLGLHDDISASRSEFRRLVPGRVSRPASTESNRG